MLDFLYLTYFRKVYKYTNLEPPNFGLNILNEIDYIIMKFVNGKLAIAGTEKSVFWQNVRTGRFQVLADWYHWRSFNLIKASFLAYIPPLSTSIRLLFLKKIKETTVQGYLNQNTKKSPGIEGAFLTIRGSWEWITLAVWIAHFIYVVSILYRTHEKILWCTLAAEHPPLLSPIQFSMFLAGPPIPPPSVPTLWMTPK